MLIFSSNQAEICANGVSAYVIQLGFCPGCEKRLIPSVTPTFLLRLNGKMLSFKQAIECFGAKESGRLSRPHNDLGTFFELFLF